METSLPDFRSRCLEATLDLLWRQWCSLGVSGHSPPANPGRLIDLESLVLATTSLGRHDPRLFDEAVDWLASFGSLINLQRLANLHRDHLLGDERVLAAVADWLVKNSGQPRWKSMTKFGPKSGTASALEPLFHGVQNPTPVSSDETFRLWGLERNALVPRGMSRAPQPLLPSNLMASLRALIGVSARVEIILHLAGSSTAAGAAELARATGYAPRTLQTVLQEMLLSGHLLSQEQPAPKTLASSRRAHNRYHLQPADWAFLTSGKPLPRWTPWASIFTVSHRVLSAIPAPESRPIHPAVTSSRLRETFAAESPALAAAGLLPDLDLRPDAPGSELLQTLAHRLPELLNNL